MLETLLKAVTDQLKANVSAVVSANEISTGGFDSISELGFLTSFSSVSLISTDCLPFIAGVCDQPNPEYNDTPEDHAINLRRKKGVQFIDADCATVMAKLRELVAKLHNAHPMDATVRVTKSHASN
jgi:hypothetical protein